MPTRETAAAGLNEEMVSKAKQSRGEKARKIMSKLSLKLVTQFKLDFYFDSIITVY